MKQPHSTMHLDRAGLTVLYTCVPPARGADAAATVALDCLRAEARRLQLPLAQPKSGFVDRVSIDTAPPLFERDAFQKVQALVEKGDVRNLLVSSLPMVDWNPFHRPQLNDWLRHFGVTLWVLRAKFPVLERVPDLAADGAL